MEARCRELTSLLSCGNIRDLQQIFPLLIDSIFGPRGTLCWSLRTVVVDNNTYEYNLLQEFLSPCGPLFKLIYNLLRESHVKYEFSVAFLPVSILEVISGML